jgi:phosphoglycolate phosphatase
LRRFDHVIFDLDGTLVDTRDDLVAAVNHVRRRFGFDELPAPAVVGFVGEGARVLIERSFAETGVDGEAALDEFRRHYARHLLDRSLPYPGISETLAGARSLGATLSVLTNKPEAMSRAILAGLDLLDHFIAVIGGDSLAVRKPDPAGVLRLAAAAAVALDRVLLVGDSPIDFRTARAAGVGFCAVAWGFAPTALALEGPEHTVERPLDLLSVIDSAA